MTSKLETRPTQVPEPDFFYTLDSLSYAQSVLSNLEDQLKEKARELTFAAGRKTVTVEDMRQAADEILGPETESLETGSATHA